jgi:enoyl-CoA hydratase/carnithine racemase
MTPSSKAHVERTKLAASRATTMGVVDGIAVVTVERSTLMNALSAQAITELSSRFHQICDDPGITGAGAFQCLQRRY